MSGPTTQPVPILTEVVQAAAGVADSAPPAVAPAADERLLAEVLQRVDLLLEHRLREALGPLLARTADALIRELRGELQTTLRELVAEALQQALARRRDTDG